MYVFYSSARFGTAGEYTVVNSPPEFAGLSHDVVLDKYVVWTDPKNRELYQQIHRWGAMRSDCLNSDGSYLVFFIIKLSLIKIVVR